MPENDVDDSLKKEYSAGKDYNQAISRPNLNLNSTLGINMTNLDSSVVGGFRNRDKILQDTPKEKKKEESMPEISEIYGDNLSFKEEKSSNDNKKTGNIVVKKIAPENMVAIITGILLVIFMILSFVLYNVFTR